MKKILRALALMSVLLINKLGAQTVEVVDWPPSPPCAGDSLTIAANVNNGTANSFQWSYRLGTAGSFVDFEDTTALIAGSTLSVLEIYEVKPWMNGIYVRVEAILNDTTLSETTNTPLLLATLPQQLTTITSSAAGLCPGKTVRLTASGGASGGNVAWYRGNPAGAGAVFVGFGNEYNAGQAGDYFVRRENACGNSAAISDSVRAFTESTKPEATAVPDSICPGGQAVLTAAGGTAGSGSSIFWRSSPNGGGSLLGQGASLTVSPSATATYYARREGTCNTTPDDAVNVVVVSQIPLLIAGQPAPPRIEAPEGREFSLTFSSSVSNATYSWQLSLETGSLANSLPIQGSGPVLTQRWELGRNSDSALLTCEVVVSANDCEDTTSFQIAVFPLLFIPDLLTPNGDGLNDTWRIRALDASADDFQIQLYNRQGSCVWGCNPARRVEDALQWDGGNLPDGAYWYLIEGPDSFSRRGALTILRP